MAALAQPAEGEPPPVEVVVCASHHHVLGHWLRVAEQGGLPRQGVTVVHVDGHPDLAVPERAVPAGWPQHVDQLVAAVDIASFQLAAARVGLVDRIVWLRPAFAQQLEDGERSFALGALPSGRLRVDDPSDYYVLDEGWAPRTALSETRDVAVRVLPLAAARRAGQLARGPIILDIDLDVFATRNPAADSLRAAGLSDAQLDALRRIFAPVSLDLAREPETRIRQLEALLAAVEQLADGPFSTWPGALFALLRRGVSPLEIYELQGILASASVSDGAGELLSQGRQLIGVPESLDVTPAEIDALSALLAELVASGSVRPSLVTVARSVRDGFTPPETWPRVEWAVLRALARSLPDARIRFDRGLGPAPRPG